MQALLPDVTLDRAGRPVRFRYGGRLHLVTALVDDWRYGGRWWLDESPRDCWLVQAGPLTAELHREDRPGGRWWLARLQD
ncbi:hypothetical protein [Deinococcus aquiradiocola]|uniref:Uncharacterized protein n=1 Tax=Deinococcus aquiradiocola TaxID=393059 RepID=A0A917PCE6_9DEIO|nr:hypothetical protein GCM10008939_13740 [Deinococcus aquiradiocola]